MEGWMEEKTEGLKCMDVCRDGWMEEFKCIGHKLQKFFTGSSGWFYAWIAQMYDGTGWCAWMKIF